MAEMTAPPRAVPDDDNGYFELLTKAVFLAGFRWSVVEAKWPAFRAAFDGFDIDAVAAYGPPETERLLADAGLVRNAKKIEGTIRNAQVLHDLVEAHGSVKAWLSTTADLPWPERRKAVAAPFAFFGAFGAYFFLWSVGESVPPHEERDTWTATLPPGAPEALLRA